MTEVQDTIQREITVSAPQERVYAAIADPAQVIKWFSDAIDGEWEVGSRPVLDFGTDGKTQLYIEAAEPHSYFAYRWIPGPNHFIGDVLTQPNTLVEFRLEETDGKTKVTLLESGFASMPADVAQEKFEMNSGGWEYMMGRLETLFTQA